MKLLRRKLTKRHVLFDIIGALLVALVIIGGFAYFTSKPASAAWFDTNWSYRKAITLTVSSSSSDVKDLATLIIVDTSALGSTKLQSVCQDLRFTSQSGKLLPYYIASSCDNSTTNAVKIWIEADLVPKNTTTYTLYMYYGNPSAHSASDSNKFALYNGLVGYWNLNESSGNASDLSGSSYTGTNYSTTATTGKYGNGRNFNGSQYLGYSNQVIPLGAKTISFWMKTSTANQVILQNSDGGSANNGTYIGTDASNKLQFLSSKGTGGVMRFSVSGTTTMNDNVWRFVTTTWDGTTDANGAKVYVNGVLESQGTATATETSNATHNLSLGYQPAGYYYTGVLDEVRVYNRNLSASEVTRLYNDSTSSILTAAQGQVVPSTSPSAEEQGPGPMAYWKLDDGQGQATNDSSSSNNDGTLGANSGSSTDDPTWITEDQCISGKCLKFDGGDYVTLGTSLNSKLVKTKAFSIGSWIKTSAASNQAIVDSADWSDPYVGIEFMVNSSGNLRFDINQTGSNLIRKTTSATVNDGKWHYVSATYTGSGAASGVTLYVDGQAVSATTNYDTLLADATSTTNLQIGGRDGANVLFNGFIDEVKIYPYARTAAQIKTDLEAGKNSASKQGSSAVLGASQQEYLSEGLVGYWKMDEAASPAADSSGLGRSGTWVDATSTSGKFGNGVSFDGAGDYVSLGTSDPLPNKSQATFATWVYLNSVSGTQSIFNKDGPITPSGWSTYLSDTSMGFYSDPTNKTIAASLPTSSWIHLAWVFDNGTVYFYKNGALLGSQSGLSSTLAEESETTFALGYKVSDPTESLDGKMDEARIYNRALSPKEVSDLYSWAPGPVGYWNFEEGNGITVNDTSGNTNQGTWSGTSSHWKNGKYGFGGNFNSSNSDTIATSGLATTQTTNITMEGWVKWNGAAQTSGVLFYNGNPSTNGYGLMIGDGNCGSGSSVVLLLGGTSCGAISTTITANTWTHVTVTRDSTTWRIYVNGVLQSSTSTTNPGTPTTTNQLGGINFTGLLDEIKIYNYSRTQKQIISDMSSRGGSTSSGNASSAVGYWKFDEGYSTVANNSGNGGSSMNGTLAGSTKPSWSNSGKFGKALSFGGSNANVTLASPVVNVPPFTACAWVKPSSITDGNYHYIMANGGESSSYYGFYMYLDDTGKYEFGVRNSAGLAGATNKAATNTNWVHLCGAWDGTSTAGSIKLYINGALASTGNLSGSGSPTAKNLSIGSSSSDGTSFLFNGLIDETKIYNYVLTADEVKLDMNKGSSEILGAAGTNSTYQINAANQEHCIPGDNIACDAPIGRWDFEEGSGTTVNDTSGNGKSGTITGATYKSGKFGKALNFNGGTDVVDTISSISGIKTVAFWINPASTTQNFIDIQTTPSTINISASGGTVSATGFTSPTIYVNGVSGGTITANKWNHVEITTGTAITGSAVRFGRISTNSLTGKLDSIIFYNYARTAAQVAYDYNRGQPVAHWKMDECQGTQVYDSSGNGNTGTITLSTTGTQTTTIGYGTCTANASTPWYNGRTGKRNSSLNFDGTDDYVTTGDVASGFSTITVSAWINADDITPASQLTLVGKADAVPYTDLEYNLNLETDGRIRFWTSTDGLSVSGRVAYSTGSITSGWNHAVATYDGSNTYVYLNGIQGTGVSTSGTIYNGTANLLIGDVPDTGWEFNGSIDDVRIYNYALTATQVKDIYNGGAINFGPVTGSP